MKLSLLLGDRIDHACAHARCGSLFAVVIDQRAHQEVLQHIIYCDGARDIYTPDIITMYYTRIYDTYTIYTYASRTTVVSSPHHIET